ncbi:hypothetical protein P691DRAFT_688990, partial [Macrolepiota fuliginosa MF-IS2]
ESPSPANIIFAIEFDSTVNYLATGDKGDCFVLFKWNEMKKGCKYKFYTKFQSHEPEFDYLKLLGIEEKINKIEHSKSHFVLYPNPITMMALIHCLLQEPCHICSCHG